MAATTISSSPNAKLHKQRRSLNVIPSVTLLLVVFLGAAVIGSPSMAASEPYGRLIQRSSNSPLRKRRLESDSDGRWRRRDLQFESAVFGIASGLKPIASNPPRKQRLESESDGRWQRRDLRFESAALGAASGTNHVSNNSPRIQKSASESICIRRKDDRNLSSPPRKQSSESESDGRRWKLVYQFESATLEVSTGLKPISINPPPKRRLESETYRTSGTNHVSSNPPRIQSLESEYSGRRQKTDRNSKIPPRKQRLDSKSGGRPRRYESRFESVAHEVPSGPNPISN